MRPTNDQLVRAALSAVTRAHRHPEQVDIPNMLDGVGLVLNELLLREDAGFFDAFVTDGIVLAGEAEALVGAVPQVRDGDAIETIIARNAALVEMLTAQDDDAARTLVTRIIDWELGLYAKRLEKARPVDDERMFADLTADRLAAYLRACKPEWRDPRVTAFRVQPGGYSKITVLATIENAAGARHDIVLRAEPPRPMLDLDGMAIASEYPLVRYAYERGLPVAEPILLETDTSHLGMRFMMSRRMPGQVVGTFAGSDGTIDEGMVRTVLALIADIANTPVDPADPLIRASHLGRWIAEPDLAANTRAFVEYWRDVAVQGHAVPSPLLNHATAWLLANVPQEDARPNLIHGDVGFHNILFDNGRLSALLDWENARYGDTAEELSMFVSSISHLFEHAQILRWYHDEGGPPVSEWRLRYFDVYMAFKIVVAAQVSLKRVEETPEHNLHLAVFGLRYLHMIGSRLATLIERAEAVKPRGKLVAGVA